MTELIPVPKEQLKKWQYGLQDNLSKWNYKNEPVLLEAFEEMQRLIYSPTMQLAGYVSLAAIEHVSQNGSAMILRSMGDRHKDAVYSIPTKGE